MEASAIVSFMLYISAALVCASREARCRRIAMLAASIMLLFCHVIGSTPGPPPVDEDESSAFRLAVRGSVSKWSWGT